MENEPVITIGALFTSIKVAVTAIITAWALQAGLSEEETVAYVGAGAAITIAVGDSIGYFLTRRRVTPA